VAQFHNGAAPWFHTLCNESKLASCRFGVALRNNGTGIQVLGELDTSLFETSLPHPSSRNGLYLLILQLMGKL
jgi:hypothetical protein